MAVIDMPPAIARYEADEEVQDLLTASPGTNLAVDFLPGSFGYDGSQAPGPEEAADIVWLDAFTANVDRTWSNPNLLVWHRDVWAIDHGAAIFFPHSWPSRGADAGRFAAQPFNRDEHVLGDVAGDLVAAHRRAVERLDADAVARIVDLVPDEWLEPAPGLEDSAAVRAAYVEHLVRRLEKAAAWWEGAR